MMEEIVEKIQKEAPLTCFLFLSRMVHLKPASWITPYTHPDQDLKGKHISRHYD
jgi:hypothetical protein